MKLTISEILKNEENIKALKEMHNASIKDGLIIPVLNRLNMFDYDYDKFEKHCLCELQGVFPGGASTVIKVFEIPYEDLPLYINDPKEIVRTLVKVRFQSGV